MIEEAAAGEVVPEAEAAAEIDTDVTEEMTVETGIDEIEIEIEAGNEIEAEGMEIGRARTQKVRTTRAEMKITAMTLITTDMLKPTQSQQWQFEVKSLELCNKQKIKLATNNKQQDHEQGDSVFDRITIFSGRTVARWPQLK